MVSTLLLENFNVSFKLEDVELYIRAEKLELQPLTIFIGPNSSGKSATAKIIAGVLDLPDTQFIVQVAGDKRLVKRRTPFFDSECTGNLVLKTDSTTLALQLEQHNTVRILKVVHNNQLVYDVDKSETVHQKVLDEIDSILRGVLAKAIVIYDYREYFLYTLCEQKDLSSGLVRNITSSVTELLALSKAHTDEIPYVYEELHKFVENECVRILRERYRVEDVDPQDILPLLFRLELPWIAAYHILPQYVSWSLLDFSRKDRPKPYSSIVKLTGSGYIRCAPSGISTAFVLDLLVRAYLAARDYPILLVIEEPELHTHPLQAVALGMIMAWLINKNVEEVKRGLAKPLRMIITTHSPELVRGCLYTEYVAINIFRRRGTEMTAWIWDGESKTFGFAEAALLGLTCSRTGLDAIRRRHRGTQE